MTEDGTFGAWLKSRRRALDLTQEALAERVGCATETIRKVESGRARPSRQIAERLAEQLDLPPTERVTFVAAARGQYAPASARVAPPRERSEPWRGALPAPLTSLVGRSAEAAAVTALLDRSDVRLVTLTGPPGIGKTRLSLQVAAELQHDFADGVVFVPLAPITDAELVMSTVAHVLEVTKTTTQPALDALKQALRDQQRLLVLDNFEQVIDAAPLISDLLQAAPKVKVLVTSRSALQVYGEHQFAVPPLGLPDFHRMDDVLEVGSAEAVRLFVTRVQAVQPGFALSATNAAAVAEICVRLDGLPLAIELAAARMKYLSPGEVLARMAHRLTLLKDGTRDLPPRHQTLQAAIDWSYSLLAPDEQRLFARLSVFAGGWTLEAAEAVAADQWSPTSVLNGLMSLVDKSLIRRAEGPRGESRFDMLETLREYAHAQLVASEEVSAFRDAHTAYFLQLAETAEPELRGRRLLEWLDRLDLEHNNLRAALDWSLTGSISKCVDPVAVLRIVGALSRFWHLRGFLSEWDGWLQTSLDYLRANDMAVPAMEARALFWRGLMAWNVHDYILARRLGEESRALSHEAEDRWGTAAALILLVAARTEDRARRLAFIEESLRLVEEIRDPWLSAWLAINLGTRERLRGNTLQARVWLEQSQQFADDHSDPWLLAWSLFQLGALARDEEDLPRAEALFEESLAIRRVLGDQLGITWCLAGLQAVCLDQGKFASARAQNEEQLAIERRLGNQRGVVYATKMAADIAVAEGDDDRASVLYEETLRLFRELEDWSDAVETIDKYVLVKLRQGKHEDGYILLDQARVYYRELDDPGGLAWCAAQSGYIALTLGDYARSRSSYEESLTRYRALNDSKHVRHVLAHLGWIALREGNVAGALELFRDSLRQGEQGFKGDFGSALEGLATIAAIHNDGARAVRLLGAMEAANKVCGIGPYAYTEELAVTTLRDQLGEATCVELKAEGRAMSLEQAIEYALEESSAPGAYPDANELA